MSDRGLSETSRHFFIAKLRTHRSRARQLAILAHGGEFSGSQSPWLTFDGMSSAARVSTPTLLVHSDDCVLPDNVRQIHRELAGPKELVWSKGSQVDFYDLPPLVGSAMQAVKPWFDRTLR
jgi:hypothetical protein